MQLIGAAYLVVCSQVIYVYMLNIEREAQKVNTHSMYIIVYCEFHVVYIIAWDLSSEYFSDPVCWQVRVFFVCACFFFHCLDWICGWKLMASRPSWMIVGAIPSSGSLDLSRYYCTLRCGRPHYNTKPLHSPSHSFPHTHTYTNPMELWTLTYLRHIHFFVWTLDSLKQTHLFTPWDWEFGAE